VTTPLFNVDMLNSDEFIKMDDYNLMKDLAQKSNTEVKELK